MITVVNLTSGNSFNSGNSSFPTASIAVSANKLYIIAVESFLNAGSVNTPTVTGAGQTWTQIGSPIVRGTNLKITFFRAMPGSGNSGALTIDHGGQVQIACSWSVEEFTNVKTTGTNGADAIVQPLGATSEGSQTGILVTLSAFASSNNMAYGAVLQQGGATVTVGSGFSSLTNIGAGVQTFVTEYKLNDNTVDWSWSSDPGYQVAFAVEIAAGGIDYTTTLNETVTMSDTVQKAITRTLSDIATVSDTISFVLHAYLQSFSDTITMSDTLIMFKNGVNVVWGKIARTTSHVWGSVTRAIGSWTKQDKTN